jgi:NADH-quinone oxidoreductase subunit J
LDQVISPVILYVLLALGGLGVCLALPRRGLNPQPIGALIAAVAAGLVILVLTMRNVRAHPNIYFYIFAVVALGGGLRMITHPRPVYAALYFILTIIASSGLFVLLSAEFMAFALIIVYAGAILITYLFVIMLATQAPIGDENEVLAEYDAVSREPVAATVVGFVLLGVLTTMMFRGVPALASSGEAGVSGGSMGDRALLVHLPRKVTRELREAGVIHPDEFVANDERVGGPAIDLDPVNGGVTVADSRGGTRFIPRSAWPEDLDATNIEGVAFALLAEHPGSIEIAAVILLMAMLGAVVLARKQVQLDEEAKARHAALLRDAEGLA